MKLTPIEFAAAFAATAGLIVIVYTLVRSWIKVNSRKPTEEEKMDKMTKDLLDPGGMNAWAKKASVQDQKKRLWEGTYRKWNSLDSPSSRNAYVTQRKPHVDLATQIP